MRSPAPAAAPEPIPSPAPAPAPAAAAKPIPTPALTSAPRPTHPKIGVQLPEVERPVRWPEMADMARAAEDTGLDSLWLGDHLLYRDAHGTRGPWEAWTTLAGLAAVTQRITLGPLVAATSFHNPAMLAKMAATVDEISGGRLILGLGAGWNETEFRGFGFPFDRRVSRFEEAFSIIRHLLREPGPYSFDGEFYHLVDCELQPQPRPGGPPILIGSIGERMLAASLPHAQAWNAWFNAYDNDPARVPALLERVAIACRAAGRDPATLEHTLAVKVRLDGATGARDRDGYRPISGTQEQIAAQLRSIADAGVSHLQLVLDPITVSGIQQLGPVLRALAAG